MAPRVLLATIRDNGLCPCPRCLMPKVHLDRTGWIHDSTFRLNNARQYLHAKVQAARSFIYQLGHAVAGTRVNSLLKLTSSVPTIVSKLPLHVTRLTAPQNSFREQLGQFGKEFNVSQMMVVNLLHEFELGVWKSLFTHLIRILHAASKRPGALVDILNTRYAGCDW